MQGPSAATTSPRRAPSRSIAATVASTTPVSAPFQPACAAPMTRARRVGEQDHAAIGAGHAEREPRRRRRQPVAAWAIVRRPGFGDRHRVGRVDLVGHGEALRRDAERSRGPGAILGHRLMRVTRPDATVQRGIDPSRDPADAGKEAMPDSRQPQRLGRQYVRDVHADFVLGWKPGGGRSLRSATAIALNSAPISP